MLAKRIIPCLDIKNNKVIKGVQFRSHTVVGDILEKASAYCQAGADELVIYDITASSEQRLASTHLIKNIAKHINIPLCVAGGIRTLNDAYEILSAGADKISVNSPALERPEFIEELAKTFGSQCVVIGVDSCEKVQHYEVYQYTGDEHTIQATKRKTTDWVKEVQARGAGEIVLNCMNQDGVRQGYDLKQLTMLRSLCRVPLLASGGAGSLNDFLTVFETANVDGALAASVFHHGDITIPYLKNYLKSNGVQIRL